jgi:hypothetical protein
LKRKKDGALGQFLGPECTDNFQVIASRFSYQNLDWYSVEQAFQSLKFPMGSVVQVEIHQGIHSMTNQMMIMGAKYG